MTTRLIEPDQPPSDGELENYIYQEMLRLADALNEANQKIEELEAQVVALTP